MKINDIPIRQTFYQWSSIFAKFWYLFRAKSGQELGNLFTLRPETSRVYLFYEDIRSLYRNKLYVYKSSKNIYSAYYYNDIKLI